jgi:hypothetical protein
MPIAVAREARMKFGLHPCRHCDYLTAASAMARVCPRCTNIDRPMIMGNLPGQQMKLPLINDSLAARAAAQ